MIAPFVIPAKVPFKIHSKLVFCRCALLPSLAGAVVMALGTDIAGLYTSDNDLQSAVTKSFQVPVHVTSRCSSNSVSYMQS